MGISYHSIKLLLLVAGIVLVLGGCSKGSPTESAPSVIDGVKSEATAPATAPTTPEASTSSTAPPKAEATGVPEDTETKTASPSGSDTTDQRVLDMSAVREAVESGDISDVDALMYQVFAQFGVLKETSEFTKSVSDEEGNPPLTHSAFSRLLMQADSLPEAHLEVLRRLMPNDSNLLARGAAKTSKPVPNPAIDNPPWLGDHMDGASSEWPQHNSCSSEAYIFIDLAYGGSATFCFPWLLPEPYDEQVHSTPGHGLTLGQKVRAQEIVGLLNRVTPEFQQVLHLQGWKTFLYIQMHEDTTISFPGMPVPDETDGSFIHGFANSHAPWDPIYPTTDYSEKEGVCHIWLFGSGKWQATMAHEYFHCMQFFKEIYSPDWLLEGTAMWAEHLVHHDYQPPLQHEDHFKTVIKWTTWFDKNFTDRTNEVLFPLLYAEANAGGGGTNGTIAAMLRASCCGQDALAKLPMLLPGDFPNLWHEISIMGFNQDPPVDKLVDVDTQHEHIPGNGPLEMQPVELTKGMEDRFDLSIAPYSKRLYLFEFQEETKPELSRLHFDLSEVPAPFRITALTKVDGEWEDRKIHLSQKPEYMFCRMKVGMCADAVESDELDEEEIREYDVIALVITNVTGVEESLTLRFHTYNPHLHGQWKRTEMTVNVQGYIPPFVVVGTPLSFNEDVLGKLDDWMKQETQGYELVPDHPDWECEYDGAYRVYMRTDDPDGGSPDYEYREWNPDEAHDKTNARGSVGYIPGQGQSLIPWRNMCTYTATGYPQNTSMLHTPHTSSPDLSIGFEIVEDDTLIISLPYRTYVYERISHDP